MKKLITMLFLVMSVTLNAQWQTDVRLTNDLSHSSLSYNNARCIVTSGDIVHVVLHDDRDNNDDIFYKRSTNGGTSWGADINLTNNSAFSINPSIAISGMVVHVVWEDNRDGNWEIYYKRSTDGGINWGVHTRLTNSSLNSRYPSISVSGSLVHIVWEDNRDGNYEIYYKRSSDGGVSWSIDTRLTNNTASSNSASVAVSGSIVYVVWHDSRNNWKIHYKRSTDAGITWEVDTQLTNNSATALYPSFSITGQTIHVVWRDQRDANLEVYYKRSTDGGTSWEADTRLTNNTGESSYPSVAVSDQVVHVLWQDGRDGNWEIYYKRSTDGGTSWEADTRLTNNTAVSWHPSISISGSVVHVVWHDERDGNQEIYYKRNPTGNVVGIININPVTPKDYQLKQNYPNPFNPSTTIRFDVAKTGYIRLVIYDVLGKEVAVLVNEQLKPGTYETNWNASNYASGIYYCQLITNGFTEINKMILIK